MGMLNQGILLCLILATRYKILQNHPTWTIGRYMRLVKWVPRRRRTLFNW